MLEELHHQDGRDIHVEKTGAVANRSSPSAMQWLVDDMRAQFGFDFTAVSVAQPETSFSLADRAPADTATSRVMTAASRRQALAWDYASGNQTDRFKRIYLPAGVGILGQVLATSRPMIVKDSYRDIDRGSWYQYPIVVAEGLQSFVAFPLTEGDDIRLIMLCSFRHKHAVDTALLEQAEDWAARATGLMASAAKPYVLHDQSATPLYAEAAHRILQAQEDERKRIARELHDGLGQELLVVQIALRSYKYLPDDEKDGAVEQAQAQLKEAIAHLSDLAHALRPAALDELGLAEAMRANCRKVEERFGIAVDATDIHEVNGLNPDCEMALYRILQEACSNACKYAHTDRLRVSFGPVGKAPSAEGQTDDMGATGIVLEVQDYGCGFDVSHPHIQGGGLGLVGMRERAAAFGGTVTIQSEKGIGTTVRVEVPFDTMASDGNALGEDGAR